MKKRYFLFGEMAARAYFDRGNDNRWISVARRDIYDTFVWDDNSDPADLLLAADGWLGWVEMTEEDYNDLMLN